MGKAQLRYIVLYGHANLSVFLFFNSNKIQWIVPVNEMRLEMRNFKSNCTVQVRMLSAQQKTAMEFS